VTTVRHVEELTGLNYFPNLPQNIQGAIETHNADESWQLAQILTAPSPGD
jgi:hypothetical protein